MDETDCRILGILKKNSRESFVRIAELLGVTEGTVRNRVKSLEKDGTIKGFTIEYEPPVSGLVILKTVLGKNRKLIEKLRPFSDNIFEISGEYDIALIVDANTIDELNKKIDKIRALRGVSGTITSVKLR